MTLEVQDVTVRFGGFTALSAISVSLQPGRILAVIGPNGSGKSTLFNSITGLVPVQSGRVTVNGEDISATPSFQRIRRGISRTFQTPRIDPEMTVQTSVLCGLYSARKQGLLSTMLGTGAARREERGLRERSLEILRSLDLHHLSGVRMGELPIGQVRMVDVARAIAASPKYLLLDEPAAGLSHEELRVLAAQIRRVAASGAGVLLVEHNFHLVKELAEDVVVLNLGTRLLSGKPDQIAQHPEFIKVYLGTSGEVAQ
ncbi:MAG: transporter related [Herminiimonas sp.]|nr:transporter related [Herminiimonas sp.]